MFADYIHHVSVPPSVDTDFSNKLIARFKGSIANDRQIKEYIQRINLEGTFKKVTYKIVSKKDINTLSFDIIETPVITSYSFKGLPISKDILLAGLKNKLNHQFNYRYLDADIRYINQLLEVQGHFLSSVRSFDVSEDGKVFIEIESPRLEGIQFIGLKKKLNHLFCFERLLRKMEIILIDIFDVDYQSLSSLPYFSSVSAPSINFVSSDNVTISYRVKERKINRLDVGLEELEKDQGVALFRN